MIKNLRWKVITIARRLRRSSSRSASTRSWRSATGLPAPGWLMAKQLKLGLDLQGWRPPRPAGPYRRRPAHLHDDVERAAARGAAGRPASTSARSPSTRETVVQGRRRAGRSRRRVPPRRRRAGRRDLRPRVRRRRHLHLHDEAEHRERHARADGGAGARDDRPPRQRAGRGRAEHLALRPVERPDHGRSCPA